MVSLPFHCVFISLRTFRRYVADDSGKLDAYLPPETQQPRERRGDQEEGGGLGDGIDGNVKPTRTDGKRRSLNAWSDIIGFIGKHSDLEIDTIADWINYIECDREEWSGRIGILGA